MKILKNKKSEIIVQAPFSFFSILTLNLNSSEQGACHFLSERRRDGATEKRHSGQIQCYQSYWKRNTDGGRSDWQSQRS